jgi:Reverse transcriptase (RNA-dependent DNA polymerase)
VLFAFAVFAFTSTKSTFTPTSSTPDPHTIREALEAPDADEWRAVMDTEIGTLRHLNVFRMVPRLNHKNVITPKWVFHQKFEDSQLVKHKACLVTCGFMQIPGIDYNEAHLYAPVMQLESFCILISIATLFDLNLCY